MKNITHNKISEMKPEEWYNYYKKSDAYIKKIKKILDNELDELVKKSVRSKEKI